MPSVRTGQLTARSPSTSPRKGPSASGIATGPGDRPKLAQERRPVDGHPRRRERSSACGARRGCLHVHPRKDRNRRQRDRSSPSGDGCDFVPRACASPARQRRGIEARGRIGGRPSRRHRPASQAVEGACEEPAVAPKEPIVTIERIARPDPVRPDAHEQLHLRGERRRARDVGEGLSERRTARRIPGRHRPGCEQLTPTARDTPMPSCP